MKNTVPDKVLVFDPLALGLANKIAPGSVTSGVQAFQGGLLLQGQWNGRGVVRGNLVVWENALLTGHFRIEGDLYVFGRVGGKTPTLQETFVECHGTTHLANTARCAATVLTGRLRLYQGAQITGIIKTIKDEKSTRTPSN